MTIDVLEQEYLQNNLERQIFDPGKIITLQPDRYWFLQQGVVKTYTWTESGTHVTFGYWGVNDLITPSLFDSPYYFECVTKVEAGYIYGSETSKIITIIQRQILQTEEILSILRADKMYQRLRLILLWLGRKFGRKVELGKIIQLRLTHQDLAELIGATRVTITKLINQLESEGFLVRPRRNTIVLVE